MQRSAQLLGISSVFFLAATSVLAVTIVSYWHIDSQSQDAAALIEDVKGLITQKLDQDDRQHTKTCDQACLAKRRRIAAQMKALQRQINDDFKNMISFGHKAGYIPPVKSIKEQVMDGSLLSSGDDEAAPPPFDPSLRSPPAFGEDREKRLLRSEEPNHRRKRVSRPHSHHESLSLPRVHSVDEMAHKFMHESDSSPSTPRFSDNNLKPHLDDTVSVHVSDHHPSSKWNKLFSFMQKGPHDEVPKVVKAPRTTIPSAVRRAIQRVSAALASGRKNPAEPPCAGPFVRHLTPQVEDGEGRRQAAGAQGLEPGRGSRGGAGQGPHPQQQVPAQLLRGLPLIGHACVFLAQPHPDERCGAELDAGGAARTSAPQIKLREHVRQRRHAGSEGGRGGTAKNVPVNRLVKGAASGGMPDRRPKAGPPAPPLPWVSRRPAPATLLPRIVVRRGTRQPRRLLAPPRAPVRAGRLRARLDTRVRLRARPPIPGQASRATGPRSVRPGADGIRLPGQGPKGPTGSTRHSGDVEAAPGPGPTESAPKQREPEGHIEV